MSSVRALLLVPLLAGPALAGPQSVDGSGYAVSGFDVVAYSELAPGAAPVPGSARFIADWNGARWAFATAEHRDRFLADPARYAPAFDGHCACGVAQGYKVPASPQRSTLVEGRLYLNHDRPVQVRWETDVPGYLAAAATAWPALEAAAASADPVAEPLGQAAPTPRGAAPRAMLGGDAPRR